MSEKIVDILIKKRIIYSEDKELYRYGIIQGAFMLFGFLTTLMISMFFNLIVECLCFLMVFIPLRTYAGGYHSNSYVKCYLLSIILMILSLGAIKITNLTFGICLIISTIAGLFIYYNSPIESENKPLTDKERLVFKKCVMKLVLVIVLSVLILWNVNQKISISFTVALVSVMVLMIADLSMKRI